MDDVFSDRADAESSAEQWSNVRTIKKRQKSSNSDHEENRQILLMINTRMNISQATNVHQRFYSSPGSFPHRITSTPRTWKHAVFTASAFCAAWASGLASLAWWSASRCRYLHLLRWNAAEQHCRRDCTSWLDPIRELLVNKLTYISEI